MTMDDDEPTNAGSDPDTAAEGSDTATATGGPDAVAVAADCSLVRAERGRHGEGVLTVVVDRPDARNALNATVRTELMDVFDAVGDDAATRCVVLTGSDEAKAFVAGADVRELRERGPEAQREASHPPRVYEAVADCPTPVIARVNGHALGGGCELALACDVRVAHERTKLGQPEVTLGIMPGGGGTQRLARLVGPGQAKRLVLSGELVDATEAESIGLVEEAVADGGFDERVTELASAIASNAPLAVERAKAAVDAAGDLPLDRGLDHERELFVGLFGTADKNEGIDAFLDDREPEWKGE